jgi:glycosyltransferase involved in cell wall biosynthesis
VATAHSTNTPIRVARIITRLNVGGPAIQAIEMSARLESVGYHTLLIHGRVGPSEGDMSYLAGAGGGYEMTRVPPLRREIAPAADAAATSRVLGLLRRFRPAIVHTHMAKAGTVGRVAALAYNATSGRRARARLVHTYHGHVLEGYFSPPAQMAFAAIERMLARRTDALVAVSGLVRRDLEESYGIVAGRFPVIPLGFNLTPLASMGAADRTAARAALGLAAVAPIATFIGRLTAVKQPQLFLDVADRVARSEPRAHFLIVGGGELEPAVRAAAEAHGLAGRVHVLGWQRNLVPVYAASDAVVITSRNEGTPVALIESMAAGVPAVCFSVGGIPDVLASPDLGILVPPGDLDACAAAVLALFADDERRGRIGRAARAAALERFGVDRLVRDLDALYRQLLE